MTAPDFKPPRRIRLSRHRYNLLAEDLLVRRRFCECGCGHRSHSVHHVVNRSQGGDDLEENMVVLNGDGTRGCHGALTSGHRVYDNHGYITPESVRAGIRRTMETTRPAVLAYVLRVKGRDWLDRHYPRAR